MILTDIIGGTMDIFKLYRSFWNWCFENPSKIKPTHIAIYSFAIEHCNRLGWKKEFGFPTTMVMEAIGVRSYSVYKRHLDEIIDFGFIEMIEASKNQYSSNIIALKENDNAPNKALDKALDKALIKHTSKQRESTGESIESIDKQVTSIPITSNKKNPISDLREKFELSLDWAGLLNDWLEYKKAKGQTYKSDRSIKSFITKLQNLSNSDWVIAKQIIEDSMANNWAGIFKLKNNENNGNNQITAKERQRQQVAVDVGQGFLQRLYDEQNQ